MDYNWIWETIAIFFVGKFILRLGGRNSKDIYEAKKNLKNRNLCAGVAQLEEFQKCFEIIKRLQPDRHELMFQRLQFVACL